MSPQPPPAAGPAFSGAPVLEAVGTFLAECGLHKTAEALRDEASSSGSNAATPDDPGEFADSMRRLATKFSTIASSDGDFSALQDRLGVLGKENAAPRPSGAADGQWLDGVLKKLAACDAICQRGSGADPGQQPDRQHQGAGEQCQVDGRVGIADGGALGRAGAPGAGEAAPPSAEATGAPVEPAGRAAEAVVEAPPDSTEAQAPAQRSEHYNPQRPSVPVNGVPDEYRDDSDPGYRVLQISEAELLVELHAKYYAMMTASGAAPARETAAGSGTAEALEAAGGVPSTGDPQPPVATASAGSQPLLPPPVAVHGTAAAASAETEAPPTSAHPVEAHPMETAAAPAANATLPPSFFTGTEPAAATLPPSLFTTGTEPVAAATMWAQQAVADEQMQAAGPHVLASPQKPKSINGQPRPVYRYAPSGDAFYPAECEGVVFDSFPLRVVYERDRTGFEMSKEFPVRVASIIAGRYQVLNYLGAAAFSRAVQCLDLNTGEMVCMKIIKNDKDFIDQSFDEIKLLKLINANTENIDAKHCLRLIDCFYHKEHLFIITELLRDNLYEFSKFTRERGEAPYFTLGRLQKVTKQLLVALKYVHSLWLIHADMKPENILMKSYSRCEVKLIDFGSSCFLDDRLLSYVQSRSYRAPEVILGLPYSQQIDIWSLGCVIAEIWTGYVLFQNDSVQSLLARVIGIIGPFPREMMMCGRFVPQYFTQDGRLYRELDMPPPPQGVQPELHRRIQLLLPKHSSLRQRMRTDDEQFLDFLSSLLRLDPAQRPLAADALEHPWLAPGRYPDGL